MISSFTFFGGGPLVQSYVSVHKHHSSCLTVQLMYGPYVKYVHTYVQ